MDVQPLAPPARTPLVRPVPRSEAPAPAPVERVGQVVRLPKTTSGGADLEQVLALGGQVRGILPPRPRPAPGVDEVQVRDAYFVAEVALSRGEPFVRVQGFSCGTASGVLSLGLVLTEILFPRSVLRGSAWV